MLCSACTYCQCFCCKKVGRRGRGSALVTLFNAVVSLHNCKCNVSGFYAALRLVSHSLSLSALLCSRYLTVLILLQFENVCNLLLSDAGATCFCCVFVFHFVLNLLLFLLRLLCACCCFSFMLVCCLPITSRVGCLLFVFLSLFFVVLFANCCCRELFGVGFHLSLLLLLML